MASSSVIPVEIEDAAIAAKMALWRQRDKYGLDLYAAGPIEQFADGTWGFFIAGGQGKFHVTLSVCKCEELS